MLKTKDLKLNFAKSDFYWEGAPRPGLPILRWPDGTICEPALYFFGYSAEKKRVRISSMRPEAFTLRQWLVYLANNNIGLFDVNNLTFETYRTSLGWTKIPESLDKKSRSYRNIVIKRNTIDTQMHRLFEFYRVYPMAIPFNNKGQRTKVFVGDNEDGGNFPIGSKLFTNRRTKRSYLAWDQAENNKVAPKKPYVPTEKGVLKVLTYLRGKGFREQQAQRLAFPPNEARLLSERNWAMATTITGGGLRCREVSDLTIDTLATALCDAGITETVIDLDAVAYQPDDRQKIIAKILSLKNSTEYAHIEVFITGKSGKERYAPFLVAQLVDILEVAVWGCRREFIENRKQFSREPIARNVFLSTETWDQLDPGAIGDIIGAAFREAGVKGSAHKLRAFYATVTAALMWKEYFAVNQYRFDNILVNNCLQRLAKAMGHASPDTTITFYMGESLFRHLVRLETPAAMLFREMWDIFVMRNQSVSKKKADMMLKLSVMISSSEDDSMLMAVLERITQDDQFKSGTAPTVRRPKLVRRSEN